MERIKLTGIKVEGPGVEPASVDFFPGLTVVVGASDTGKTYIANTVDFLLGSTEPPPDNPFSRKYNKAFLGVESGQKKFTVGRDFRESVVQIYEHPLEDISFDKASKQLPASQRGNPSESLSQYLLSLIGLSGKQIRKNQYGEKSALTLRHVAHLTVISEEKIIAKISPVLSGESIQAPLERAIFSFFLTGIDDADLSVVEKPKDRKARLDTEEGVVQSILSSKEEAYAKLMGTDMDPILRLAKIETAIEETTGLVSATQGQISELESNRKELWTELQKLKSRDLFNSEQLKRFSLLQEFYQNDRHRLESVIEAGNAFESLPGGECAVCGSKPGPERATTIQGFMEACTSELKKLDELAADLRKAITDVSDERTEINQQIVEGENNINDIIEQLARILQPQSIRADKGLTELIRLRTDVSRASDLLVEIKDFQARIQVITAARKQKLPKSNSAANLGTARAANFCAVIQETLKAWKYPLAGNVSFDPSEKRFDIVIGDQDRGSMGKGYRAITHAAFVISLMKYCRRENIPHPGFVLLDTPLNPFKGPDEGPSGKVNDEVKNAFYEALATDKSGDQYIILENTEPPPSVIPFIRYHHFSKNISSGRYGFFPTSNNLT
jgi:hypothetical protein